jgi:ABC-type transporter Mla MlaB component
MATKDSRPNLLSKMAMFVRNPTKDWSELDRPEPEQETSYDKQALKAMIERKRQNDFVRRREFDNLRKLRRNDPAAIAGAARPSFFQSSLPADAGGRADTLKKIDEIEAQMSKQWWKGKQEAAAAQAAGFPIAKSPPNQVDEIRSEASTIAPGPAEDSFESTALVGVSRMEGDASDREFEPTEMGGGMSALPFGMAPNGSGARQGAAAQRSSAAEAGFSSSELFAIEPDDMLTDPELEEAAIRFANGDDAGAESALVGALAGQALRPEVAEVWVAALLDLYRATGRSDAFDRAAMDHACWLNNLRPRWVDIALNSDTAVASLSATTPSLAVRRAVWACPVELTAEGMEELRIALSGSPPPWHLDWSRLNDISDDALPFLAGFFGSLCAEDVALRFSGADRLTKALRDLTPSGSRGPDETAWTVRLDALRTMQLQDEFELAALDFCITFEVAPPAWEPARCRYLDADQEAVAQGTASTVTMPLSLNGVEGASLVLSGQILGDAVSALALLGNDHAPGAHLLVSCKGLVRVDFSAAGSILNWVATCHSKGCQVQFRDVNRLVAAFFNVIGITEYARVTTISVE